MNEWLLPHFAVHLPKSSEALQAALEQRACAGMSWLGGLCDCALDGRALASVRSHFVGASLDNELLLARELRDGGSGLAWNASADRSHWRISFSEGQAPVACQGGLWDPDLDSNGYDGSAQPPWNAGSAQLLEQVRRARM